MYAAKGASIQGNVKSEGRERDMPSCGKNELIHKSVCVR